VSEVVERLLRQVGRVVTAVVEDFTAVVVVVVVDLNPHSQAVVGQVVT